MNLKSRWLTQGYFDVTDQTSGRSIMQAIRHSLEDALRCKLRIVPYPVGPSWKHTYWWREGEVDYAEAQFFMRIAEEYPMLSMGVSVEKGLEDATAARRPSAVLDRSTWDWQRLIEVASETMASDVPAAAAVLSCPIEIRAFANRHDGSAKAACDRRTFVLSGGHWFERHVGTATPDAVVDHLRELDQRQDWWVDLYFACDLHASEVDGINAEAAANLLLKFNPIRERLRARS